MATLLHMPASPPTSSFATGPSRPSVSPLPAPPASFASRPGLRRNSSSSSIILSPVLRFSTTSSFIPSPSESILNTSDKSYVDHSNLSPNEESVNATATRCSFATSVPSAKDGFAAAPASTSSFDPLRRTSLSPVGSDSNASSNSCLSSTSRSSSGSGCVAPGGSLLQRRRSSAASGKRPDVFALTMKIPDLPPAPLDELLDDTVPSEVIGVASAAVTPSKENLSLPNTPVLVVKEFRSTRTFVPTPFPEKKDFISDDEDEALGASEDVPRPDESAK